MKLNIKVGDLVFNKLSIWDGCIVKIDARCVQPGYEDCVSAFVKPTNGHFSTYQHKWIMSDEFFVIAKSEKEILALKLKYNK